MIKLKNVSIAYHIVETEEDGKLVIMMCFRVFIDEIKKMVGVNVTCEVDFFLKKCKEKTDNIIVELFLNQFINAFVSFIQKQKLPNHLITSGLVADAIIGIVKCVDFFAEHDKPYNVNIE